MEYRSSHFAILCFSLRFRLCIILLMELSIEQLREYDPDSYRIIDIRTADERAYGEIPGALTLSKDALLASPPENDGKLFVIVCRRGVISRDVADELEEKQYNAASLTGGYGAYLLSKIQESEDGSFKESVERSIRTKFKKTIWSNFTKALKNYRLVNAGDRIAVCMSGGKDSMLMAKLFQELKRFSDVPFDVEYLVMDPGYSKENRAIIEENARRLGIPIRIFESDIFDSVFQVEKTPCYLCARMRRGHLYAYAKELGCNKIALGHHYDDVIETILMGMLYGAQIQTMMPKLHSTNFEGMELIRPLYLIREEEIKKWRDYNHLRFLSCACKFTETCTSCGDTNETKSKRLETKRIIAELKKTNPDVENHIFRSVENVSLDTVIAYKKDGVVHHFLDQYNDV